MSSTAGPRPGSNELLVDESTSTRTRVLWLTKGLGRGGVERLLVSGAQFVDRRHFDVEVAYMLPWKDAFVEALEAQGIRVHCLDARHVLDPRWIVRLRRLIRTGGFDILHTHMPLPAVAARLVVGKSDPTIVHTEHNLWPRYRAMTRWANALTYRRNRAVMAVSSAVAKSIREPRHRRDRWPSVEVVLHGADLRGVRRGPRARADARARLGLSSDAFVVGTVGNLTTKKDHEILIRGVEGLSRRCSQVQLVLVGAGPREAALRELVRRLGVDEHVTLVGPRDDVFELLPGFDVFALSSRHEGLPIALLEAMASGVACVATSVGGVPEVITDGVDGLLIAPADSQALEQALAKLHADAGLREAMGFAASRRAADFDLEAALRETEAVYGRVLATR